MTTDANATLCRACRLAPELVAHAFQYQLQCPGCKQRSGVFRNHVEMLAEWNAAQVMDLPPMRKPGIILLCGEPDPCAAVRTALAALGPGMRCEVWTVPDASEKLREAVREHDGDVWVCGWDPDDTLDPCGIHVNDDLFLTRPTWGEVVGAALTDWPARP